MENTIFQLDTTLDNSIEALEKALAEEQEIADQLIKNAEKRKQEIADKITEAKAEKRKLELHKITEIVKNLHAQYGEDFIEVVKKEIKFKPKKAILSTLEKDELKKFMHIFNRGYKGSEGKTYNHLGVEVKSNIPAQKTFDPQFSMSPKKYSEWYEKYTEIN